MANKNRYNGPRIYDPFEPTKRIDPQSTGTENRKPNPDDDGLHDTDETVDEELLDEYNRAAFTNAAVSDYDDDLYDETDESKIDLDPEAKNDYEQYSSVGEKFKALNRTGFLVIAVLTAVVCIGIGIGLYFLLSGKAGCKGTNGKTAPTASASADSEQKTTPPVSPDAQSTPVGATEPPAPLFPFPSDGVPQSCIDEELSALTSDAFLYTEPMHHPNATSMTDEVSFTLEEDRPDDTYRSDYTMRFAFDQNDGTWHLTDLKQTEPQPTIDLFAPSFSFGGVTIDRGATEIDGSALGINGADSNYRFIPKKEVQTLAKLCPDLQKLQLNHCWLETYEPLSQLKKLTVLDLVECGSKSGAGERITDISWIAPLTDLMELRLNGNAVSDVTPLAGMQNLKLLNLSDNLIDDSALVTIAELHKLEYVNLYVNRISDLTPLTALENVTYLNVHHTDLKDIDFLKDMPSLTMLYIGENYEGDPLPEFDWYNVLKQLPNLKRVNVRQNDAFIVKQLERLLKDGYISDLRKYK